MFLTKDNINNKKNMNIIHIQSFTEHNLRYVVIEKKT